MSSGFRGFSGVVAAILLSWMTGAAVQAQQAVSVSYSDGETQIGSVQAGAVFFIGQQSSSSVRFRPISTDCNSRGVPGVLMRL